MKSNKIKLHGNKVRENKADENNAQENIVRGNNVVSNTLNKKIGGRFAKKQKLTTVIFFFSILFVIIAVACINMFGFKEGVLTAVGFSVFVAVIALLPNEHA